MRKLALVTSAAVALLCSIAVAATVPDSITVTAKAQSGGTKKKPKTVSASFVAKVSGADGNRAITPAELRWTWTGIKSNGAAFPRCSAATIDAAQSDASCPKGSQIGSGTINAVLGPETDRTNAGVPCIKDIAIYSDGAKDSVLFLKGDPAQCAGVVYLPPVKMTIKKSGADIGFVVPDNVGHPLPGLEGSINELDINYDKVSVKKGGKKVGYLTSTGCKGKRNFTFTQTYPDGAYDLAASKASAGSC